jgi:hypothetical protein
MSTHVTPNGQPMDLPRLPLTPGQMEQVKGGATRPALLTVHDIHMNQGNS